jgi:hypothetical protein
MAAGQSRTLKLSILGETKQLVDALKDGETGVKDFESRLIGFSQKSALAFAAAATAAAAYATKLVVDGVQSAIQDEAAQLRLASALKTATSATDAQIQATETYISKTSLATGIADDKLRPAFQKLAVATGDVTKSQDILNLAIDVSRGTGVELESIVTQLSKAYAGQDTGLAKLGVGITAADAKTMTFKDNVQRLSDLWGGAAAASSETLSVKLEIMKNRFNEAKESVGTALLPILTKFAEYILANIVPAIEAFVAGLTGDKSLVKGFKDSELAAYNFGERAKNLITTLVGLKEEIGAVGIVMGAVFGAAAVIGGISTLVNAIKTLIIAYNALKASAIVAGIASYFALNPAAGLAATAVAAGILATANAMARNGDVSTDFSSGGTSFTYGSGNPMDLGAGVSGTGGSTGGFSSGGFTGGGAGGSAGGTIGNAAAAVNLPDLVNKLTTVSDKIAETTFLLQSGAISSKTAQSQLNALQKQFDVLSKQAETLNQIEVNNTPRTPFGQAQAVNPLAGGIYGANPMVTVNMGVVGDPEAAARAVVGIINDSYYRGTGGAGNYAGF